MKADASGRHVTEEEEDLLLVTIDTAIASRGKTNPGRRKLDQLSSAVVVSVGCPHEVITLEKGLPRSVGNFE